MSSSAYDLVIVGGTAGGLSVAVSSQRSGLSRVRIIEPSSAVVFPALVGEHQLDVGYGETVQSIARSYNVHHSMISRLDRPRVD